MVEVVVVGGGAAGIMAARHLHDHGVPTIVLEAHNSIGGRAKSLKGFLDWKDIDLGAEFIHGDKTLLKRIVDQRGYPCRRLYTWAHGDGCLPEHPVAGGMSMYYLGKEDRLLRSDVDDPEVKR